MNPSVWRPFHHTKLHAYTRSLIKCNGLIVAGERGGGGGGGGGGGDTFCGGGTESASRTCLPGQNPLADCVPPDRVR